MADTKAAHQRQPRARAALRIQLLGNRTAEPPEPVLPKDGSEAAQGPRVEPERGKRRPRPSRLGQHRCGLARRGPNVCMRRAQGPAAERRQRGPDYGGARDRASGFSGGAACNTRAFSPSASARRVGANRGARRAPLRRSLPVKQPRRMGSAGFREAPGRPANADVAAQPCVSPGA